MSIENEDRSCNMCNIPEPILPVTQEKPEIPCECKDEKRKKMLKEIKCLEFAVIELALYLDTHPTDEKALCLHNKYCKELKELKDIYQKIYGPLTINYPCNKWRWLEEPWPWEGGNK